MFQQPNGHGSLPRLAHNGNELTLGTWTTEDESATALDNILSQCDLWAVYSEVRGILCQPRPAQEEKGMRIDRVLVPNQKLRGLGWAYGVIGIEIKKSGIKLGPPIAQAMDYSRTIWTLDQLGGIRVWLDWVFIWPMPSQAGTIASVLSQNRIGSASASPWILLQLKNGALNLLQVHHDGTIEIGPAAVNGTKAGSR